MHVETVPGDVVDATTTLGDWYAHTLNVGRLRLLMCTSERSLLTVLVPAKDITAFPERLRLAIGSTLASLGVPEPQIVREQREMRSHRFDRTRSRQVLGSMNDFAFLAETYIRDDGADVDLELVARFINRAPCRPIKYQSPDAATLELFRRSV